MYSGVNDENNQGAFNDESSLYHYSYSKDREPQPGQPDPSQTSWQPASQPEDPVSPEEPVAYTTGTRQDDSQSPKPEKGSFWKKTGTKVTTLVLCCALIGGLCGFGGASLARRGGKATIQESGRTASAVSVKSVDGQTLMTPAEVYASTVNSVVSINCSAVSTNIFGQKVQSASSGSGFVITQDGYIVTNQHVVSGASSVNVTLYNGDTYPATVVGGDSDYDVAVLKIEATGLQAVTLGKSADVNVGDTVMAIGNPLGELTFSMSQGIVSCCDRAINVDGTPFNMIQVDASINPGNSGGPLMNLYGEVVGIVSAKYSSYSNTTVEGIGFAIPISDVQTIITDIMENGQVTDKAYMAIKAGSMTEQMAAQYNINVTQGVFVYAVEKGGAGEKAGLQLGDVITKLNDTEITSMSDLSMAKKGFKAGDTVTLTVWRGGQEITLSLTFDEQPQTTGTEDDSSNQNQGQQDSYGDLYDYFFGRGNGGRGN
jgi:serine protease Do